MSKRHYGLTCLPIVFHILRSGIQYQGAKNNNNNNKYSQSFIPLVLNIRLSSLQSVSSLHHVYHSHHINKSLYINTSNI